MPLDIAIPGRAALHLTHLVLDVNGTLSIDGALLPGVTERIALLRRSLHVQLVSADTHGQLDSIAVHLGVTGVRVTAGGEAAQKARIIGELGAGETVAIGNGANDVAMLDAAALAIAVLEREGTAAALLGVADILARSADDALDLLLNPRRVAATLRH